MAGASEEHLQRRHTVHTRTSASQVQRDSRKPYGWNSWRANFCGLNSSQSNQATH